MSYEEMLPETVPCSCGKGTVLVTVRMDDWNRVQISRSINCPVCSEAASKLAAAREQREAVRQKSRDEARRILADRHMTTWLNLFAGMKRAQCHAFLYSNRKYPSLPTFYKHVRDSGGLERYLRAQLTSDVVASFDILGVDDPELRLLVDRLR